MVQLLHAHVKKPIAAIGDGGNDVSMIQAANVGIGIVGREGKQASLAADFSITQFHHVSRLLVWHGRNRFVWEEVGGEEVGGRRRGRWEERWEWEVGVGGGKRRVGRR